MVFVGVSPQTDGGVSPQLVMSLPMQHTPMQVAQLRMPPHYAEPYWPLMLHWVEYNIHPPACELDHISRTDGEHNTVNGMGWVGKSVRLTMPACFCKYSGSATRMPYIWICAWARPIHIFNMILCLLKLAADLYCPAMLTHCCNHVSPPWSIAEREHILRQVHCQ